MDDEIKYGSACSFGGESSRDAELEDVRHYERVALEANIQLRESGIRLQNGAIADSVRAERLHELENMFSIQNNELELLRRDRKDAAAAAKAAEARYAALAASQQAVLWNGDGACFPEQRSDEKGAPYDNGASRVPDAFCKD